MKELIEQCWSLQADKRPEFWQIVKVLEHFEDSMKNEGKLDLMPNQICPELKKGAKYWIQRLGWSVHNHASNNTTNTIGPSALPKPRFA
ncbi:unnamed protein product [Cochlearia groenlandica]